MKRTFVIADIHGCNRTFNKLLSALDLEKPESLYLLGDYIDRGPDSKGVIDTILRLQLDGYDIRPIRGNHEQMLLDALFGDSMSMWLVNGGCETLQSYGVESPADIPHEHLEFIRNLPHIRLTDSHVFVHAGLDFSLDDPLSETSHSVMLWTRMVSGSSTNKLGGRKVVAGHSVKSMDEIIAGLETDIIQLDNGCFMGARSAGKGNLVALELNANQLFVQKNIG